MAVHRRRLTGPFRDLSPEDGATMVEYVLLLALIAVALIGALHFFADGRLDAWQRIGSALP